ncbi:VTT domain-containing protein [Bacillus stercoris]|uniref:VTT domain-containing protein n=1 Tax=Bacillus stercoris TaxID=2054641 RepID=A0ABU0V3V3_9BACI|nr:VTT domain-containing protein [Bacillus stercoris]MDQ1851309.1 VTT domain-containing protein [Bacillus stercoris]
MQILTGLLEQHGYAVLFIVLMLELIALPGPGEFLMGYAGVLVFQDKLNWVLSMLAAGLGSCAGVSISYWIGYRLGPAIYKYGERIHFGKDRMKKTSRWLAHYGNKLFLIAYFIPGVRHVAGYAAGITHIRFRQYAIYAYCGAFLWTGTFISLGKLLGPDWEQFHAAIKKYVLIGGLFAAILFLLFYLVKTQKSKIRELIIAGLVKGARQFHTLRHLRLLIVFTALLFLMFVLLMGSLVENYINNEFKPFDTIVTLVVTVLFNSQWQYWMAVFGVFASRDVLLAVIVVTFLWTVFKGQDRKIELSFLFFLVIGGELYKEGIRRLFHSLHPVHAPLESHVLYPFPSEQTLTAFVIFGFCAYLFVLHSHKARLQTVTFLSLLVVLFLIGLSRVYFHKQYPSDVVAGYAFGGVWLSLNVFVMELFRFSRRFSKLRNEPD